MIRPVRFAYNEQTAVNNAFQQAGAGQDAQGKALQEFDDFVALLRAHEIDITVVQDTPEPHTPDSIFPNNWISFHHDGTIMLYPMFAPNRRLERKETVLNAIASRFEISYSKDLSGFEADNLFLEGTGSMVLDRINRTAYACLSPRTDKEVLDAFCKELGYTAVIFHATDHNDKAIYHTNVLMCIADRYAVICLDSIRDKEERDHVSKNLADSGREIIPISLEQMNHFAGNMLQVENREGKKFLVMSSQAYRSLTAPQQETLLSYNEILHSPLDNIEKNGGGSARCMMAEIHLPVRS